MTISLRSDVSATLDEDNIAGSDAKICQAARVSTLGSAAAESGEARGLINYLMKHRHGSPFEHGQMSFLVEAPIFVAREWMRHRVGWSYNETSGRYKELDGVFYVPGRYRPLVQRGKAGEYEFVQGTDLQYDVVRGVSERLYEHAWSSYQVLLDGGIAREVARNVLPVGIYTSFYATCNPRSLMHFLSLRTKSEDSLFKSFPQEEIDRVATDMEVAFANAFPLTYEAFVANRRVAP